MGLKLQGAFQAGKGQLCVTEAGGELAKALDEIARCVLVQQRIWPIGKLKASLRGQV